MADQEPTKKKSAASYPEETSYTGGTSYPRERWEELISTMEGRADPSFIDKLIAVHSIKDRIQAAGYQIDRDLLDNLSELFYAFQEDVQARLRELGLESKEAIKLGSGPNVNSKDESSANSKT